MYICIHGKLNRHESNRYDQNEHSNNSLGLLCSCDGTRSMWFQLDTPNMCNLQNKRTKQKMTKETLFRFFPKMKPEATF